MQPPLGLKSVAGAGAAVCTLPLGLTGALATYTRTPHSWSIGKPAIKYGGPGRKYELTNRTTPSNLSARKMRSRSRSARTEVREDLTIIRPI